MILAFIIENMVLDTKIMAQSGIETRLECKILVAKNNLKILFIVLYWQTHTHISWCRYKKKTLVQNISQLPSSLDTKKCV